jgi:hypothetical protein
MKRAPNESEPEDGMEDGGGEKKHNLRSVLLAS